MAKEETLVRFEDVSFEYGHNKHILEEVDLSVRNGTKITIMGQNGAGKSTIFGLIIGEHKADNGDIHVSRGITIATARQVIRYSDLTLTVREFFEKALIQPL